MTLALFFILSFICLAAVLGMIISRNPGHSALLLVLAFAGLGGIFGLLDAPFLAVVQIIIYAGAIMVLFIFVIMMVRPREGIPAEKKKASIVVAILMALILAAEVFLVAVGRLHPDAAPAAEPLGRPSAIGRLLLTDFVYAFELTSILILAALVGALALGKKRPRP